MLSLFLKGPYNRLNFILKKNIKIIIQYKIKNIFMKVINLEQLIFYMFASTTPWT